MKKSLMISLSLLLIFSFQSRAQFITTLAGGGTSLADSCTDTAALLSNPYFVHLDNAGNVYFADYGNNVIREIGLDSTIKIIAGSLIYGYSGDGGPATAAQINNPVDVLPDNLGNIYFSDFRNQRICKIDASGTITTYAGTPGSRGYTGDNGPATDAQFNFPAGIALDKLGNLYIADQWNNRIREVSALGTITTIAGTGPTGFYSGGYSGDGGPATAAMINFPNSVAVDTSGNIYFSDQENERIRKIDPTGIITTIAGIGVAGYSGDSAAATAAMMSAPEQVASDVNGNIFFADQGNSVIRKINSMGIISTVAGNDTAGYSGDGGSPATAELNEASGIAIDAVGNMYISDLLNERIRKITVVATDTSTGIAAIKTGFGINIFPDPVTTTLTIIATDQSISQVTITNILGQTIYTQSSAQMPANGKMLTVNCNSFPPGIYAVTVTGTTGQTIVRKIMKQ